MRSVCQAHLSLVGTQREIRLRHADSRQVLGCASGILSVCRRHARSIARGDCSSAYSRTPSTTWGASLIWRFATYPVVWWLVTVPSRRLKGSEAITELSLLGTGIGISSVV